MFSVKDIFDRYEYEVRINWREDDHEARKALLIKDYATTEDLKKAIVENSKGKKVRVNFGNSNCMKVSQAFEILDILENFDMKKAIEIQNSYHEKRGEITKIMHPISELEDVFSRYDEFAKYEKEYEETEEEKEEYKNLVREEIKNYPSKVDYFCFSLQWSRLDFISLEWANELFTTSRSYYEQQFANAFDILTQEKFEEWYEEFKKIDEYPQ